MARPICVAGVMPPAPPRPPLVIFSAFEAGSRACERCNGPTPIDRPGECFQCEHHDRAEAKRIARERALAAYGEGRC